MNKFTCPYCNTKINLVWFGGAWIGICCRGIVYSSETLPQTFLEEIKDTSEARDA